MNTFRVNTQGVRDTTSSWTPGMLLGNTDWMPGKPREQGRDAKAKKTAEALLAGERIRCAREAKGLSQDDLSALTGGALGGRRIGNWEQGTREVGIKEAKILAAVLGQPAAYLMGLVDEMDCAILTLPLEAKRGLLAATSAVLGTAGGVSGRPAGSSITQDVQQSRSSEDRPIVDRALPAHLQRRRGP